MRSAARFLLENGLAIGLAIGLGSCVGQPPTLQEVAAVAERAGAAVWRVEAEGCGWRSVGSAFSIGPRHLVTNQHVIANDSSPMVRSRDGVVRKGRVVGAMTYPDVAVIEVERELGAPALRWMERSALGRNDPVVVIGYPAPKHQFTASPGLVVGFYGDNREAALTNAPIAKGNSGGPGVTSADDVAGVVTLMRLQEDADERVAIMFTADAIRDKVASFMSKPKDVLSSCGLGPDYVPRVPKDFEIASAPPTAEPAAGPTETPAATKTPPSAASPTPLPSIVPRPTATKRPPCPSGGPVASVGEVTSVPHAQQADWWFVDARGTVRNDATFAVWIREIEVTVDGTPPERRQVPVEQETLPPRGQIEWRFSGSVYSPGAQPTAESVSVALEWRWSEGNYHWCPTG